MEPNSKFSNKEIKTQIKDKESESHFYTLDKKEEIQPSNKNNDKNIDISPSKILNKRKK